MRTPARSFFVGGRRVSDGDGGHTVVDQMYVQRLGDAQDARLPVVLFHGGAQSGAHYEHTPDGRAGLGQLLAAYGRPVYIVDLPGVGRSRYHAAEQGPLTHYSAEFSARFFTAPADHRDWPQAVLHTQWPGTGRIGDPVFEAFYASQVGRIDETRLESAGRAAGDALVERIGPCHLLTHSQSGPLGWHIADQRPGDVRSIVALEPKGPPFFDPRTDARAAPPARNYGITARPLTYDPPLSDPGQGLDYVLDGPAGARQSEPPRALVNLRDVPVVVMTAEASYHVNFDHHTVDFLRRAGVPAEHIYLAEHGLRGNGHLMAIEQNNADLAALIGSWLSRHDEPGTAPGTQTPHRSDLAVKEYAQQPVPLRVATPRRSCNGGQVVT